MKAVIHSIFLAVLLSFFVPISAEASGCGPITTWDENDAALFFDTGSIYSVTLSNDVFEDRKYTTFSVVTGSEQYQPYGFTIHSYQSELDAIEQFGGSPCQSSTYTYVMYQASDICIKCAADPYPPDPINPEETGVSYQFTMTAIYGSNVISLRGYFPNEPYHSLSSFQALALSSFNRSKTLIDQKCELNNHENGSYVIRLPSVELCPQETFQFLVYQIADGKETLVSGDRLAWFVAKSSSISPYIGPVETGRIDNNGLFTALNIGTCLVRAKVDNATWLDANVTVKCQGGLTGDLDRIKSLYKERIPEGRFHKDMRDGKISFPFSKMNPGYATNLYSIRDPAYKPFNCGGYQGDVLKFLHAIQANANECAFLSGYDFGPIQASFGGHQAVVVFPKGTDWQQSGLVLDPWYHQKPEYFPIEVWKEVFSFVDGSTLDSYRGIYPTTTDPSHYDNPRWTPDDLLPGDPGAGGVVMCPVEILLIDDQGRRTGVLEDGSFAFEIPDAFFMKISDSEEENQWYFKFRQEGQDGCRLNIKGKAQGVFELITTLPRQKTLQYYGEQPISEGKSAQVVIDIDESPTSLTMPDGGEILPTVFTLPEGCLVLGEDLSLHIPCAKYQNLKLTFTFRYANGLLWEIDPTTLNLSDAVDCIDFGTDLSLSIPCAEYLDFGLGFTMNYANGLLWQLDANSLKIK